MYIAHIKFTLHNQVLVYCENVPTQLIMGTAQKIDGTC